MAARGIRGTTASNALTGSHSAPAPSLRLLPEIIRRLVAFGEGLAYSSSLAALVGGAMTWAAGRALSSPHVARDAALVACGAFLVYNVDRLRDLPHDRLSSPGRSAFVLRNRQWLVGATGIAGLALIALFVMEPPASVVLCLSVGSVGLLHRRLKRNARLKVAYVAAAWTASCVGLPWIALTGAEGGAGPSGGAALVCSFLSVGSGVTANLVASNLREGKRSAAGWTREAGLVTALGLSIVGVSAATMAPEGVAPLAWIPAAEAASIFFFRETERFGHLAVDGALLLGALVAVAQASL
jgi:hypothetical protein